MHTRLIALGLCAASASALLTTDGLAAGQGGQATLESEFAGARAVVAAQQKQQQQAQSREQALEQRRRDVATVLEKLDKGEYERTMAKDCVSEERDLGKRDVYGKLPLADQKKVLSQCFANKVRSVRNWVACEVGADGCQRSFWSSSNSFPLSEGAPQSRR
ncbi:MAG: hypothetical protein HY078_02330 [Elusimicrobia bacterium]|nr:hypothetical protein [Elusimicrobiota bacterium]